MSNDQRRKAKKKKEATAQKRLDTARQSKFIDGIDTYTDEFNRVLTKPPLRNLFGIFQLSNDEFYGQSTAEKLRQVGLGHLEQVRWNSDHQAKAQSKDDEGHGAGMACGVVSPEGRLLPVIFIRTEVPVDVQPQYADEFKSTIRLLTLLHEIGHAEDMMKEINFNLRDRTVDLVAAEAYAHRYVLRHLQKRNCRIGLNQYIGQLDRWTSDEQTEEYVRLAAARVTALPEIESMRLSSGRSWANGGWQKAVAEARIIQKLKVDGSL